MKRLFALALILIAGNALAAIEGSKHDFATASTAFKAVGTGASEICAYCHTPHAATTGAKPLWNKTLTTLTTYTAYGTTIKGTDLSANGTISGTTQLCLGCHDGTVAPGSVVNAPNSGWTDNSTAFITGNAKLNNTFADDHPVNFTLSTSKVMTTVPSQFPLEGNTKFTCATCHDVHNSANADPLLVTSNANSDMCQLCHSK